MPDTDTYIHTNAHMHAALIKVHQKDCLQILHAQSRPLDTNQQIYATHLQKQHTNHCTLCISNKQMQASRTHVRKLGKTICRKRTPTLYMSNLSGLFRRHRMGDSKAATGRGGALGVCTHTHTLHASGLAE